MKRVLSFVLMCTLVASTLSMNISAALIKKSNGSIINAETAKDGYFTASYTAGGDKRIKVMVEKDGHKYTYDLKNNGESEVYPLQLGDGQYKIRVLRNTTGTKYSVLNTYNVNVKLENPHSPFLTSSQYVNYNANSNVVKTAAEITEYAKNDLEKVDIIYNYVVNAMSYDKQKAQTVQSGYLPDVDLVVAAQKGICFDYAAVMAAMLRSQGIPAKLVTGYVAPNNGYHAWNEVYIKDIGWIKTGSLYFDGSKWTTMDPTFTSSAKTSASIAQFIGNGKNYSTKYIY